MPHPHLSAFLLIDRSGSMTRRWADTIAAVNQFVAGLAAEGQGEANITVATFDSVAGPNPTQFDILRKSEKAAIFPPVTTLEAFPRGGTPLYDACVRAVALAEAEGAEKTVIAVLTDGEENQSTEATKDTAKAAFDRARERGWEVVFLGVDFDAFKDAASVGTGYGKTLNVNSANLDGVMRKMSASTALYASSARGAAMSDFTDEDRAEARKQ